MTSFYFSIKQAITFKFTIDYGEIFPENNHNG